MKTDVPGTTCSLDKAHASLIFRVSHLAFSNWMGRFASFDANLMLDSKNPANSHVEATIDPNSLASDNPPPGFLDMLHGAEWLNAGAFPQITFQSTKIVMTAPNKADVTGDLTLHGVTKQVTLHTTFNGGWAKMPLDQLEDGQLREPRERLCDIDRRFVHISERAAFRCGSGERHRWASLM